MRDLKSFRERASAKALERERVRACVRVCEKERVCVCKRRKLGKDDQNKKHLLNAKTTLQLKARKRTDQ